MTSIGVFDSGRGGHIVAEYLRRDMPEATIDVVDDAANVPYGSKSPKQIFALTDAAIQPLLGHDVIVIACNTATAVAINKLRATYPDQVFVGFEPMVKTAANRTRSGSIAILATPATLVSDRYISLKRRWASGITVLEPDCRDWAQQIELGLPVADLQKTIDECTDAGADHIVLACTHYLAVADEIATLTQSRAAVLSPYDSVLHRIRTLLNDRAV